MSETHGIILRLNPYRDADLIAVVLTKELGKVNCLARSARKSKHRFFSGLQLLDSGDFLFSRTKTNSLNLQGISNKISLNDIGRRPSNYIIASLFSEILDQIVPEEDPEYALLIEPLLKTLKALIKSPTELDQLSFATWFLCKVAQSTGIDPRHSQGTFRKDDLTWYNSLCDDNLVKYEPIAASKRAFDNLIDFIESTFQIKLKIKSQLAKDWKF